MAKKRYYGGEYAGMDGRRAMEARDGAMIAEDRSAVANLPQQVVMREYPACNYMSFDINDDITGVDELMKKDGKQRKNGSSPAQKYETT